MKSTQAILKIEGYEKEDFFDQLTYDLAKSYEAEMKKDLPTAGQTSEIASPLADLNHKA